MRSIGPKPNNKNAGISLMDAKHSRISAKKRAKKGRRSGGAIVGVRGRGPYRRRVVLACFEGPAPGLPGMDHYRENWPEARRRGECRRGRRWILGARSGIDIPRETKLRRGAQRHPGAEGRGWDVD